MKIGNVLSKKGLDSIARIAIEAGMDSLEVDGLLVEVSPIHHRHKMPKLLGMHFRKPFSCWCSVGFIVHILSNSEPHAFEPIMNQRLKALGVFFAGQRKAK